MVIQTRGQNGNPGDYFEKTLAEYEAGFEANGELWLGLEKIAEMTASGTWELEVDVLDWSGRMKRATYGDFKVGTAPRCNFFFILINSYKVVIANVYNWTGMN